MNEENLKKLYQTLTNDNYDLPSYDQFRIDMQDDSKRSRLYNNIQGDYELPDFDTFTNDMGVKKKEGSSSGVQTPSQPSTPSGSGFKPFRGGLATEEEARPKVGKNAPEMIKQEEIVVKEPLTDEQKGEITLDLSKRLATFPTSRQEAEASFEKEQQEKRDLARQERLNKGRAYQAYTGNPNVDVATLEVQYQEALDKDKREMETAKKMGIEYTPSIQPIEIKNKIEDTYKVIESDYLRYLQATDPDRYSQYTDRISTIEGKEKPSLEDQKFLTQLRAEAVDAKTAASEAKIADIKAGTDLAKFSRVQPLIAEESRKLQGQLEALVNPDGTPKSPESAKKIEILQQQAQGLQDRYNQLVEETGVTDEVVQQLNNSYDWLTGGEVLDSGWQRFPELKSAERLQLEEQAIRKDIAENGGMLSKSALMVMSFMDSVGSGVVSMAQAPKVLADSLGYGKENGWTDVLYDLSTDINTRAAGRTAPLDSENNILDVIDIFSKGAGSVVQFAAGGSLGGATKAGQFAATTATAFLMTEGDAYREALAAGISSEDAAQYATMIALAQGMTESVIPDIKYFDPAARASILAAIKNKTGVKQAFKEYAETIVKDVPKVGLKEGGEEIVTEVTGDVIKEGINAIRDQKIYQDTFDGKNYLETFLSGFVTGGGMQMLKRGNKNLTPTEETVPRAIGENADAVLETIAYASPDNAVEAAETVGGLREIVMGLQGIPSYQNLGAREKDFVVNSMARKAELEKSMKEAGMKDEATLQEIEKIESDVNAVYAGKKVGEEYRIEDAPEVLTVGDTVIFGKPEQNIAEEVPPVAEDATASVGEVKAPDASITQEAPTETTEVVEEVIPQEESTQTGIKGVVTEEVTPEGVQKVDALKDEKLKVYHGGGVKSEMDMWEGMPLFVTKDKSQAQEYTKGNNGEVIEFLLDNKKIATEDDARKIISELGLQSKEEGWDTDELNLFELIDPTFDTSFSDEDIKKLFKKLEDKGYEGIEFTDTNLKTLKQDIQNIVVFNPQKTFKSVDKLSSQPNIVQEVKEKPLLQPKYKPEVKSLVDEVIGKVKVGNVDVSKTEKAKQLREGSLSFTPDTIEGRVRQYFSGGGKVSTQSLREELGIDKNSEEFKSRFGLHSEKSESIDRLSERLHAGLSDEQQNVYDSQDIRNTIIEILGTETRAQMSENILDEYLAQTSDDRMGMTKEQYDRFKQQEAWYEEEMKEKAEAEQAAYEEMFSPDVLSALDAIEAMTLSDIEQMYGEAIDEDGNINEDKFNEIYNRNEKQGTESEERAEKSGVKETTRSVQTEEGGEIDALKDVESTAKALEGMDKKNIINKIKGVLYRGQQKGRIYQNKNAGVIYFTPKKEYAEQYGDEFFNAITPDDVFDIRQQDNQNVVYEWLKNKIDEIELNEEYEDWAASRKQFLKDAKVLLKSNNPKSLMSAMANVGFAEAGGLGNVVVGKIEKEFMEDNNINSMYQFEAGGMKDADISIAFRDFPSFDKQIAEAYHAAKADGSNPELVQAVESLLGQTQQAVAEETKPNVFDAIEAAERSKKTVKGKQEAAKEVAKEYGELGEKAIFVNENFKEIVESLKELRDEKGNKVLTVKC